MKRIRLSNREVDALVSNEDYESLMHYTWRLSAQNYVVRREYTRISKGVRHAKDVRMHRQIMGEPEGLEVDHINGLGIDNQRENLRVATHRQNLANRSKQSNNTSGYKGVTWSKNNKKWWANIYANGKTISLGYYSDIKEAAQAYNNGALKYQGDFARLNKL